MNNNNNNNINYNTKYECLYLKDDLFILEDNLTNDEKDFYREIIYRKDLFNIFYLDEYDNESINKLDNILESLYKILRENNELNELCKNASNLIYSENNEDGLKILYNYDFMNYTHLCVSEFLEKGHINYKYINKLKNKLY